MLFIYLQPCYPLGRQSKKRDCWTVIEYQPPFCSRTIVMEWLTCAFRYNHCPARFDPPFLINSIWLSSMRNILWYFEVKKTVRGREKNKVRQSCFAQTDLIHGWHLTNSNKMKDKSHGNGSVMWFWPQNIGKAPRAGTCIRRSGGNSRTRKLTTRGLQRQYDWDSLTERDVTSEEAGIIAWMLNL